MAAVDFEPDSARCRLFARGAQRGYSFGAYGNAQFVASATAGAALGYAIGSAVERSQNFNDCMQARGWCIADGSSATQDGAMTAKLAPQLEPMIAAAPAPVVQASYHPPSMPTTATTPSPLVRRDFLARAVDITPAMADSMHISPPHGVQVVSVDTRGAAWAGGIRDGDIVLGFNGSPVSTLDDMVRKLSGVEAGTLVSTTIWRNGTEKSLQVSF